MARTDIFAQAQIDSMIKRVPEDKPPANPGLAAVAQPVHTVYGGANLFTPKTFEKLSAMAAASLAEFAPDASVFEQVFGLDGDMAELVFSLVERKLQTAAIEDYRIDFEDGYGVRSEEDEDNHAVSSAIALLESLKGTQVPRLCGIRVKPLSHLSARRALRTLDLFFSTVAENGGRLPSPFIVTLPKNSSAQQISLASEALSLIENKLKLPVNSLWLELLIEHPDAIVGDDGRIALREFIRAGQGRCSAFHLGAYDYTSLMGISAPEQKLHHASCDFVRHFMQLVAASAGIWVADGASNFIPLPPHRGANLSEEQHAENAARVHQAWRACFDNVYRSLTNGFYQGWDLHPAQFIPRYAATYNFFFKSLDAMSRRLSAFLEQTAQATRSGEVFDDAATGHGLINFVLRALDCSAVDESYFEQFGVSSAVLRTHNFAEIVRQRRS